MRRTKTHQGSQNLQKLTSREINEEQFIALMKEKFSRRPASDDSVLNLFPSTKSTCGFAMPD